MAKKSVIDLDCDQTIKFEKVGQSTEGYYVGAKQIETEYGKSKLHIFQGEDGSFGVFGSAKLDDKLSRVPAGFLTTVTFEGKVKLPGGKTMKKFDVSYDDELSIDVESVQVNLTQPSTSDDAASDDAPDVDDDTIEAADEDSDAPETNPVQRSLTKGKAPAAVVSAAQRSAVQNLLSKSKR